MNLCVQCSNAFVWEGDVLCRYCNGRELFKVNDEEISQEKYLKVYTNHAFQEWKKNQVYDNRYYPHMIKKILEILNVE